LADDEREQVLQGRGRPLEEDQDARRRRQEAGRRLQHEDHRGTYSQKWAKDALQGLFTPVTNIYDPDDKKFGFKGGTPIEYNANLPSPWEQDGHKPLPFDKPATDLLKLFKIEASSETDAAGKPKGAKIVWDDEAIAKKLKPKVDKEKQFKGFEKPQPAKLFTAKDRDDLALYLTTAFDIKASKIASWMDPPDSLNADAKATMNEYWNGMSNDDKLKLAQQYDAALAEENAAKNYPLSLRVPKHLDPLNETTGTDYRLTQAVAKKLFVDRATQIVKERGIGQQNTYAKALHEADADKPLPITEGEISNRDDELWRGWVDSSTSDAGLELQVAIAEELGGRLLTKTGGGGYMTIDPDAIKKEADGHPGGYALVKALVRAKWETTQWMLERAGIKRLNLYRTIALPFDEPPKTTDVQTGDPIEDEIKGIPPFHRLDHITIKRNGAASTRSDVDIANRWDGEDRVVLRAHVPRTTVVSVPAYGAKGDVLVNVPASSERG
jgi:hypothetical protein